MILRSSRFFGSYSTVKSPPTPPVARLGLRAPAPSHHVSPPQFQLRHRSTWFSLCVTSLQQQRGTSGGFFFFFSYLGPGRGLLRVQAPQTVHLVHLLILICARLILGIQAHEMFLHDFSS